MSNIVFELCAEGIDACLAARAGGAHRIELCSALSEGGITPSHGLIRAAVQQSGLPVHVLLRPRGGDFVYSDGDLELMREDLEHARSLGVSGVVLGLLRLGRTVDVERTRMFVEQAGALQVTFNRAFDTTVSKEQALEDVIDSGCTRLLTSGGERDVLKGAESLSRLVKQAQGRIEIAVGGGLRLHNAATVARTTAAQHFHGSLQRPVLDPTQGDGSVIFEDGEPSPQKRFVVDSNDVRQMIQNLNGEGAGK